MSVPRVRHLAQFKSRFEALLASSTLYGGAKSFNPEYATTLIKQAEKGVDDLVRLARLDGKLHREQKVVRAMQIGIEQSLVNGDPLTGLLFLHDRLCAAKETDDSVAIKDIQDELKACRARAGLKNHPVSNNGQYNGGGQQHWAGPPIQPISLAPYFHSQGGGGGHAFHAPQQFSSHGAGGGQRGQSVYHPNAPTMFHGGGGSQGSHGYYGPPNGGRGHTGGRGRGGRGPPGRGGSATCSKCMRLGKAANHSFRQCPQTSCHKCGQTGHIQRSCPN